MVTIYCDPESDSDSDTESDSNSDSEPDDDNEQGMVKDPQSSVLETHQDVEGTQDISMNTEEESVHME